MKTVRIGLVGEFKAEVIAHQGIPPALTLAGAAAGVQCEPVWIPTASLEMDAEKKSNHLHGIWCVPNTPYVSEAGALNAIRFAREGGIPFLGTCGGFQHAIMEFARDVLGIRADHAEVRPDAIEPVVKMLSCWMVEKTGPIIFTPDSKLRQIYGVDQAVEGYHCRFGPNPIYERQMEAAGLRVSGRNEAGEVRAMELTSHPFFIGTLFQPERSALAGRVHPLILAFVRAAADVPPRRA